MEIIPTLEALIVPAGLVKPQRSTFQVYSDSDWMQFCTNQEIDSRSEAVYLPRTLSAHLHANTDFVQLYFFHEFYGHGSFCEYSAVGKRIVAYENELAEIEKAVLGVTELPENTRFRVENDNPLFVDYKTLREELHKYCAEHYGVYEGFALWSEKQLAFWNGLEEQHGKRMELVDYSHTALLAGLEHFVKQNGIIALFETLGFEQDVFQ